MKSIIKRQIKIALLSSVLLTFMGCSVLEESTSASSTDGSSSNSPVLSDSDVAVANNFRTTIITEGLERPWGTEHGSRGGDEVNIIEANQNYGWPEVSYSDEYTGAKVAEVSSRPDVLEPELVWTPSIAPSGLAFYSSDRFSQWQGDLFAGGLVSRDVRRIDLDEEGNILGEESISIGQRVRDVRQGPDGMLYVLTDEQNGSLISIEPEG